MRKILILAIVLVISCLTISLFACNAREVENVDPIEPKDWQLYIGELSDYLTNSLIGFDINKAYYYDYSLRVKVDSSDTSLMQYNRDLDIVLRGNVSEDNGEGIFTINNRIVDEDIIYVYYDEEKLYVNNDDGKVIYDNAYINDAINKMLSNTNSAELRPMIHSIIDEISRDLFTDGYANHDGSEYVFDFCFNNIFNNERYKWLIDILPGVIADKVLDYFSVPSFDELQDKMPILRGQVHFFVNDNKVTNISIKNEGDINSLAVDVNKMSLDNGALDEVTSIKPIDEGYVYDKLGKYSYNGVLDLMAKDSSIATYDVSINSNIDMLKLYVNDFDLSKLDVDDYFHLRVSHKCYGSCGAYCLSKYLQPSGSVFEVAFSPKDFGNNNMYVVASPRALLNREAVNTINSEVLSDLLFKITADYKLFTIDTGKLISTKLAKAQYNVYDKATFIVNLLTNIDSSNIDGTEEISINHINLLKLFGISDNYIQGIRACFGDGVNYADTLKLTLSKSESYNYDIANATLYIIDKYESNTKQYISLSDLSDPALSWEYNDYSLDKDTIVHNIYDASGNVIYGKDTPMSIGELDMLRGGMIKYKYTNYNGEVKGEAGDIATKIVDVISREPIEGSDYQNVTLKVEYPSKWSSFVNDYVSSYLNDYLYDLVTIKVKFNDIASIDVQFAGKDTYYYAENIPRDILDGIATIVYDGGIKQIPVKGKCDTLGNLTTEGRHSVIFNVLDSEHVKYITVLDKSHNNGTKIVYGFRDTMTNITNIDGVWHIKTASGARITNSAVFSKVKLEVNHTATYSSTRNVDRSEMYYIHNGKRQYLDHELRGVWILDSNGEIIFNKTGNYTICTSANGIAKESFFVIDVVDSIDEESRYVLSDGTKYREHYFDGSLYQFRFDILNSFHGQVGRKDVNLGFMLQRGYTNDNGNLAYEKVNNIDDYITIESIEVNGVPYRANDAYGVLDLPESIRNDANINFNIRFKRVGYYKIGTRLDNLMPRYTNRIIVEHSLPRNQGANT